MLPLILATSNSNKKKEIEKIFHAEFPFQFFLMNDFPELKEVDETEGTLEENAMKKSKEIYLALEKKFSELIVLSDDTGLEIDALHGEPGVYSARYASLDSEKHFSNSELNIQKVLQKMDGVNHRTARFRTIIGIAGKLKNNFIDGYFETILEGMVDGTIATKKLGEQGFGYDPIFIPQGERCSFAQMSLEQKNEISHRSRAIKHTEVFLNTLLSRK